MWRLLDIVIVRTLVALICVLAFACSALAAWAQETPAECQPGQTCEYADPNAMADVSPDLSATADPSPPREETPPQLAPLPAPPTTCGAPANPWNFTFCGAQVIRTPPPSFCSVFACIPTFWRQTNGYVMQCRDGLFS